VTALITALIETMTSSPCFLSFPIPANTSDLVWSMACLYTWVNNKSRCIQGVRDYRPNDRQSFETKVVVGVRLAWLTMVVVFPVFLAPKATNKMSSPFSTAAFVAGLKNSSHSTPEQKFHHTHDGVVLFFHTRAGRWGWGQCLRRLLTAIHFVKDFLKVA